jgi:hypothetical protein
MTTASYHGVEFRIDCSAEGWSYRYEVEGQEQSGMISPTIEFLAIRRVWGLIDRDIKRLSKVPDGPI